MGSEEFSPFLRFLLFFFAFLGFFSSLFFVFLRFALFFFAFLSFSPRGQGQKMTAIYCKNGNFTPTPSALTPCRTSRLRTPQTPDIFRVGLLGCSKLILGAPRCGSGPNWCLERRSFLTWMIEYPQMWVWPQVPLEGPPPPPLLGPLPPHRTGPPRPGLPEHCKKSQGGWGEEGGRGRGGKGFGLREGSSNCNGGWGGTLQKH